MSNSSSEFIPRWARQSAGDYESLGSMPHSGVQPEYRPKLVTRLLPADGGSLISARTLVDTANTTQRVLQYVGQELAFGPNSASTDLRTIGKEIADLSAMKVEPFEEGSFIIPAILPEEVFEINGKKLTGSDVLERFYALLEAFSGNTDGQQSVSLGLVQSVYDLGRIVRREAAVEYTPIWGHSGLQNTKSFVVDASFIDHVSKIKATLVDRNVTPNSLKGRLTALDINRSSLSLTLPDKSTVKGSFELLMQPTLIDCMNEWVEVWGVVESMGGNPTFIRVFTVERLETDPKRMISSDIKAS